MQTGADLSSRMSSFNEQHMGNQLPEVPQPSLSPDFAIIDTDHYSKSRISSTGQRKPASMDADTADIKGFQLSQGKNKCSLFSIQTNVCL